MGNFQQHITCSTVTGIAIGGIAYHCGLPPSACLVAAGLCSFAGMLPDIDSNTSKSFQECLYLTAGVACILVAAKLRDYGIDSDLAMLGGALVFLLTRFGLGTLIKKYTAHRGMIHSIPVAALSGQLTFFVVTGEPEERLLKAFALTVGFLSHLVLDEMYSIESKNSAIRLKRSFGTALKWANPKRKGLVTALYTLIFCLGYAISLNFEVMHQFTGNAPMVAQEEQQPPHLDCEIRRAAAAFLSQYGVVPAQAPTPPVSELPSAMQIGNDWHRDWAPQPARIVW